MSSTDPDVKDNVDAETNAQIKTPSPAANQSKSSSPAYSTLLVIDDSSNSEEPPAPSSTDIPAKPTLPLPPQISDIPPPALIPPSSSDAIVDFSNDTPEQHRRRNSSIAKLLGGQPLNNQYEEINQQIIGHQSALIANSNGENGFDVGNQRSRSFITRTLLMNPERTNSFNKVPTKPQATSSSTSSSSSSSSSSAPAPRDFEYLIRQVDKPDNDHPASMLQRHNSAPKLIQNLTSLSNAHAQLSNQSKLKRKRSMLSSSMSAANISPFSLHEPFELQSSATNSLSSAHQSHSSNDLLHLESAKRARLSSPQRYNPPVNPSSNSPPSYPYTKLNMNSALYNQFNVHREALASSNCVLSYPCPRFPQSSKLTLPSPVTHVSPPASRTSTAPLSTSPRKAKSIFARSDGHDAPRQRSFSSTFNPSDSPLASSAEPSVPLKKRLLHAYNNEQRPTTPL